MWVLISFLALFDAAITVDIPLVNIGQGSVLGSVANDGDYFEFYGIPYADSTSGSHRFKAPRPPPHFTDTFTANRRSVKCVRPLGFGFEGTEDCLVADVFTPTLNTEENLPVMVWINGREFDRVGEPDLSFRNLVEKDVIVVSLNYRESILGFLCLGTETAPGNAGLKDIVAGLRWVKENIVGFGGNPHMVTVFGHGSGGAAVDLLTLSPLSEGLVHKAITQSGNSAAPWAVTRDPLNFAVIVAKALGHEINDTQTLSEIFTRTSVAALMGILNDLELTDNSLAFAPCIENKFLDDGEPFLLKSPFKTLRDGDFIQIPYITGFVENEGTIRAEQALNDGWLDRMDESFVDFIQTDLKFESEDEELSIADDIRHFYFNENAIDMNTIHKYLAYHGDTLILVSSVRNACIRASMSLTPVYLYEFSYEGPLGEPFVGPLSVVGATHSEELAYLFHSETFSSFGTWDIVVSNILVERWTNFAKTGVPHSESSNIEWEPITTDDTNFLRIMNDDSIEDEDVNLEEISSAPHLDIMTFWNEIYDNHFKDATSIWELDEEEGSEEGGEGGEESEEDEIEESEEEENSEEDDSASTAIAYTFTILTFFGILNYLHLSQIQSF